MSTTQSADKWLDAFFEHYYRSNPVNATFIGVHDYDTELPRNLSAQPGDEVEREARELLDQIESGNVETTDDVARQVDLLLASSYLRTMIAERQSGHLSRNPCLYTGEAIFGIVSLFLRNFAPLDARIKLAVERLQQVPRVLQEGTPAIDAAPDAWVGRAITECDGAERLLRDGLPLLVERSGAGIAGVTAAAEAALAAFAEYRQKLVERSSAPQDSSYAIGSELFDQLVREAHFLDMTADEIADYARGEMEAAREALSSSLTEHGYSDWQTVADLLADEHPSANEYVEQFQNVWDEARRYAIDRELLTWPDVPIVFEQIYDWARTASPSLYFLFYRCPPPFDDGQTQRNLVPPIDGLSAEQQKRLLRTVNDAQISMNHVIHHAGLGHHVQNWHARRAKSRVARMAGNDCSLRIAMQSAGTYIEGWACYATDLMAEAGFLTPLQEISTNNARMRMAARAIVDVELHSGRFSLDDAIAFYVNEAGMSQEASRGEAIKNSMFPSMAMMYLMGTDLIHDLRSDMQQRWGDAFSLRRFHDEFLSWGAIPVTLVARLMRGEALEPGAFSPSHQDGAGRESSHS